MVWFHQKENEVLPKTENEMAFWVSLLFEEKVLVRQIKLNIEENPNIDDLRDAVLLKFSNVLKDVDAVQLDVQYGGQLLNPGIFLRDVTPPTTENNPLIILVPQRKGNMGTCVLIDKG